MARARALGARGRRFESCFPDNPENLNKYNVLRLALRQVHNPAERSLIIGIFAHELLAHGQKMDEADQN